MPVILAFGRQSQSQLGLHQTLLKQTKGTLKIGPGRAAQWQSTAQHALNPEFTVQHWKIKAPMKRDRCSTSMSYAAGWLCSPKCLNRNTNTGTLSITMLSLFPCYHIQIFDNILHLISDLPESSASLCLHMWSMSKHEPTEATVASQSYRM